MQDPEASVDQLRYSTNWRRVILAVDGIGLVIALIVIAVRLHSHLGGGTGADAIQFYVEALFQAVIAVGIGIALYIFGCAFDT